MLYMGGLSMNMDPEDLEEHCKKLREWPINSHEDLIALLAYLKEIWWCGYGWSEHQSPSGWIYSFSTGGWSDNEDLVGSLQDNLLFWALCWQQSRRGGHYRFHIRKPKNHHDAGENECRVT
jgi:hypothetical protein